MFLCAQLNGNDVVTTVARLKDVIEGPNIIPLTEGQDVLGWKYDRATGRFYRLVTTPATAETAPNQPVTITLEWLDESGALVADLEQVTALIDGQQVVVPMDGGRGELEFVAEEPGTYRVEARSQSGVSTTVEVTVR